ncbi:acyl-CoA dehydrogenase [Thioclava nitratireducens]|uniref:Medium-chain specific acyl-CoA dehydrogenase, mitochondrial n=1 Tax=Thioclava nitratireducens TaxID=1915078 RepID=A0ABN4XD37_9RHOB|nr:acyl-CoA dehydrogenase family protein [Thioclava nitratireducens]AQS47198.1 acyl-CoA dehydrogenase [Thioclava nitratireducens]
MTGAELEDYLSRIRSFARERVTPAAAGWAQGRVVSMDMFRKASELGLTGLEVTVKLGGSGLGYAMKAKVCETLAAADFGFAMSLVNTHNVALKLSQCASDAVQKRYIPGLLNGELSGCTALTEHSSGSDFGAISMRAVRSEGGWTLNGEKIWITNARHASVAIVYAQCGDIGARDGIAAFVVDLNAEGSVRRSRDAGFSLTSAGIGDFSLSDVFVPDDHLLLAPGTAFKSILTEINGARTYVAAMCCGMLDAALDEASSYGQARRSFGKSLAEHQGWRFALAQAEVDLAASCALVTAAIAQIEGGSDAQLLSAQAKIHAVQTCQRHLATALHAMGAEGLRQEHCVTRHIGAAQIAALVDGTTEMLLERVAKLARPASQ